MIDSTESPAIEAALQNLAGKCIINSINLEDGEERAVRTLELCRRYGAGVVALTIDEEGMAGTADRKVAVAHRLYDLAVSRHGLPPEDIFFDALTFTLGSGDEGLVFWFIFKEKLPYRKNFQSLVAENAHIELPAFDELFSNYVLAGLFMNKPDSRGQALIVFYQRTLGNNKRGIFQHRFDKQRKFQTFGSADSAAEWKDLEIGSPYPMVGQ